MMGNRKKKTSPIRLALLCLMLAMAIFLTWPDSEVYNPPVSILNTREEPNAFLENTTYRIYDEKGSPSTVLLAKTARVFEQANKIEIEQPSVVHQNLEQQQWKISALNGLYDSQNEILELHDNVEVKGDGTSDKDTILIQSQYLKFDNKTRFISSNHQVNIATPDALLEAGGMTLSLDDQTFELFSTVKGYYLGNHSSASK